MKLMIYAHYDHDDQIKPYVLYFLSSIRQYYSNIIFVTNSKLTDAERQKIITLCDKIYLHNNIGYDFGMWKLAIQDTDIDLCEELALANSSFYGPVFPLQEMFSCMDKIDCDFWGITENYEHDRHLQSYYLVFKRNVIQSDAFKLFWDSVLEYSNKFQVIRSYEIGLTQWLLQYGYKMGAYCPWQKIVKYTIHYRKRKLRGPTNPTIGFGTELLKLRSPFVKVELLRDNPYKINLEYVREMIAAAGYPSENILSNDNKTYDCLGVDLGYHCPRCKSVGKQFYGKYRDRFVPYSTEKWRFMRCTNGMCGVLWLIPIPTPSQLKDAYNVYYTHGVGDANEYYPPHYSFFGKSLLWSLKRILTVMRLGKKRDSYYLHGLGEERPAKVLEVGCGSGDRLVALRKLGWKVEGQEVDPVAVKYCREKQGLHVFSDRLEELLEDEGKYDVILMSHVLEHVENPDELLRNCLRLLKPGGKLLLTTPNIKSLGCSIYGKYWFPLDPPRHLLIYSPAALKKIILESGFDEVSVTSVALNNELISLHSRDIRFTTFTDFNDMPRIGKELVPLALQLFSLIFHLVFPNSGEECFAKAIKRR